MLICVVKRREKLAAAMLIDLIRRKIRKFSAKKEWAVFYLITRKQKGGKQFPPFCCYYP